MKKKHAFFLLVIVFMLFSSIYADLFTGEWKLFINSDGTEIADNQLTIGLDISKNGIFYNVKVTVPTIPTRENSGRGDTWAEFLQANQDSSTHISLQLIKQKYEGKYLLSDDEKAIENINGSGTFKYKKMGNMLLSKDLGCFKKGKANIGVSGEIQKQTTDTGSSEDEAGQVFEQPAKSMER